MGVLSFYRWLVDKYPKIVATAIEEKAEEIDSSQPNPNGFEFDNLYLDMNGIIHPCFYPPHHDTVKQPTTYEDVFDAIFEYIEHLFALVRPRKLLYLAIDGVAPRAKMNHQRSRRFRNARNNAIVEAEEERLRKVYEKDGKPVFPKEESQLLDSNIVTPGTEFMYKLSKALGKYISSRLQTDPGWENIMIILSDANVPGEGEHKIMSYIRDQRNCSDYNPNTRHCLYGLDADLILLALATHELNFSILREDLQHVEQAPSTSESGLATVLTKAGSTESAGSGNNRSTIMNKKPYQFVHVRILREYLKLDLRVKELPVNVEIDGERIIDDFVFMCCFIGNDFLPRMPTLCMHEGAMNLLITVYKNEFKNLGGYIVDMERVDDKKMGFVKLKRVEKFILAVGTYEEKIFQRRSESYERMVKRVLSENASEEDEMASSSHESGTIANEEPINHPESSNHNDPAKILENTMLLQEELKNFLRSKDDLYKSGFFRHDKVKLGTLGWKERYYKEKFQAETPEDIESIRKNIVEKYTEGLIWVLKYYYSGVESWTWFYPYYYGPFASDLKELSHVKFAFEMGAPFAPFDQLMGTLPPRSAHALPKSYQRLMIDENSSIIDFYPQDFELDTDGVRFVWLGVSKLSFIEEARLLNETKKLEKELGPEECKRNAITDAQLFFRSSTGLGGQIRERLQKQANSDTEQGTIMIDNTSLSGLVRVAEEIDEVDSPTSKEAVLRMFYKHRPNCRPHIPRLLAGVDSPEKTIYEEDIMDTVLWHENRGRKAPQRFYQYQNHHQHREERYRVKPSSGDDTCEFHEEGSSSGWMGRGKSESSQSDTERCMESMRITDPNHSSGHPGRTAPTNNLWRPSYLSRSRGERGELPGSAETMSRSWQQSAAGNHNSQQSRGRANSQHFWSRDRATTCTPRDPSLSPAERKDRW